MRPHVHAAAVACRSEGEDAGDVMECAHRQRLSASNRLSAVRVRVSQGRLRSRPLEKAAGQEVESRGKLAEETL